MIIEEVSRSSRIGVYIDPESEEHARKNRRPPEFVGKAPDMRMRNFLPANTTFDLVVSGMTMEKLRWDGRRLKNERYYWDGEAG